MDTLRDLDNPSEIGRLEWNKIMVYEDPTKFPLLLYTLHIISLYFMSHREGDPETTRQRQTKWKDAFHKSGGITHIRNVLLNIDLHEVFRNGFSQRIIHLLLSILFQLGPYWRTETASSSSDSSKKRSTSPDSHQKDMRHLVVRLIRIIHHAVQYRPNSVSKRDDQKNDEGSDSNYDQFDDDFDDDQKPSIQLEVVKKARMYLQHTLDNERAKDPELDNILLSYEGMRDIIVHGLLRNDTKDIREQIYKMIDAMSKLPHGKAPGKISPILFFADMLLGCLSGIDTNSPNCVEYFQLVTEVVAERAKNTSSWDVSKDSKLASELARMIHDHPITELRQKDSDKVLQGLLCLLREICAESPEIKRHVYGLRDPSSKEDDFVSFVFRTCLFELPKPETEIPPPLCKSPSSRSEAFRLLEELAANNPQHTERLVDLIIPNHLTTHYLRGSRRHDWDFSPGSEESRARATAASRTSDVSVT